MQAVAVSATTGGVFFLAAFTRIIIGAAVWIAAPMVSV
jgi:hypothetical protein